MVLLIGKTEGSMGTTHKTPLKGDCAMASFWQRSNKKHKDNIKKGRKKI
jgi:hypothetical protein